MLNWFVTLRRPSTAWASLIALAVGAALPSGISAQPIQRISATVAALSAYTTFFHSRPVLLRARAEGDLRDVFVTDGERQIRALNVAAPAPGEDPELLEIEGTFWDVGRLQPDDSRLDTFLIGQLSERLFNRRWPVSGELMLLIADETQRAAEPESPTIQAITLEPSRYLDRPVTVIGRFRGRNLYCDLPEAPRTCQYDCLLQSDHRDRTRTSGAPGETRADSGHRGPARPWPLAGGHLLDPDPGRHRRGHRRADSSPVLAGHG